MPIQYPDFRADPNGTPKISGWPGFIESAAKGYQLSQMPQQIRDKQALQQAQLQKTQQENQFYPQQAQANLELTRAQANKENNPYGDLTGDVGNAFKLQQLKDAAAKDPSLQPYYDSAKKTFDLNMDSRQSLMDYRSILNQYAPKRFSTNIGKLYSELAEIKEGNRPGTNGNEKLSPEEQEKLSDRYNLAIIKATTDEDNRKRVRFASNIETTLGQINPTDLTRYSGIAGQAEMQKQKLLSQVGKQSPEYDDYLKSAQAAMNVANHVSQFWSKSIQPGEQEKLRLLANPSTWDKNPQQALLQFNTTMETIRKETANFRGALNKPDLYEEKEGDTPAIPNSTTGNKLKAVAQKKASGPTDEEIQEALMRGPNG